MKFLSRTIFKIAALYCVVLALLFVLQRQILYFPSNIDQAPEAVGLTGVEVVRLDTPDGETITLWHAAAPQGRPTVLFFHGNGGEIADRANRFQAYQDAGFGALFVSYRGYGGSTGAPTEAGLIADARAAYDWLIARGVAAQSIAVVGESLGTAVAVQLAAEREVGALLLGAPFTAAVDIAARTYPWAPVRLLMKDQFRSRDHIARVTAPIFIQHGTEDRIVPFEFGRALSDLAGDGVTFLPIEGATHQMLYQLDSFNREIAFIESVFAP
ncbi:MAG: alpha/beta fold hydrolase [Pseudomonadota bacterium]